MLNPDPLNPSPAKRSDYNSKRHAWLGNVSKKVLFPRISKWRKTPCQFGAISCGRWWGSSESCCEGAEWPRKPQLRQTCCRWHNEITPFMFQKPHCQQCFQTQKWAEVIRSARQQAAGTLVGAPHLTFRTGAKRNWQGSQKSLVGLLSPEAVGRVSLGRAEAFTGVNV